MNRLILGNVISLIGSFFMVANGLYKEKKKILTHQIIQLVILAIGNLVLGGLSGFIANALCIIRNLICIKYGFNTIYKIIFMSIQAFITFYFNNEGWLAIFPYLGVLVYVVVLDTKDPRYLKIGMITSHVMWAIYRLAILNITGFIFDILTCITNSYTLYKLIQERKVQTIESTNKVLK